MGKAKRLWLFLSLSMVIAWMLMMRPVLAEEAAPQAAEPQGAAPQAAAPKAPAPKLPAYFTTTSPDPNKPMWPDPTGGNSGTWATPAGDAKGDIPDQLKLSDLYDRIAHNLYSINYVWVLVAGFWSCSCRPDSCSYRPASAGPRTA